MYIREVNDISSINMSSVTPCDSKSSLNCFQVIDIVYHHGSDAITPHDTIMIDTTMLNRMLNLVSSLITYHLSNVSVEDSPYHHLPDKSQNTPLQHLRPQSVQESSDQLLRSYTV